MIDGDQPTLHIRCGSDIQTALRDAGFGGDFLEYADPVHDGPLPDAHLIEARAHMLATRYGLRQGFTEIECLTRLQAAEQRLSEAASRYRRVVLWFEHDHYDQLILGRCLARLAEGKLPEILELICIDRHTDVARFNGLGQLGAAALAGLWPARQAVTEGQIALGKVIWAALRQPDPTGLQALVDSGTPALPLAAPALRRHLRELPAATDGLSLTQRLVLTMLANGPMRIGRMFEAMVTRVEPLVFIGDIGFLDTVEAMAPLVLTIAPGEAPFPRLASITEAGRQVLAGVVDYLTLDPPERWVGNVRTDGRWRWDDRSGVTQRPA